MRYLWALVWLLATAHECRAQLADPMANAKLWPMVLIDEEGLMPSDFPLVTFPDSAWQATKACAAAQGIDTAGAEKPTLRIVASAHSIRVHDLTIDSLVTATAPETTAVKFIGKFTAPTIAYTLLRRNLVLVVPSVASNVQTLMHESMHALLWNARKEPRVAEMWATGDWHPAFAFEPCVPGFRAPRDD